MADFGHKMIVIGKQTGSYKYHKNVEVIRIPGSKGGQLLFVLRRLFQTNPATVHKLYKSAGDFGRFFNDLVFYLPIINSRPDRVHIQWASFLHKREMLFELFSDKILLSLRGAHINYTPITHPDIKATYERVFPQIRAFHAVSDDIGREATKYNAPVAKICTIYSFVDDELIRKPISEKIKGRLNIVSVGRFIWVKGYDYALDAIAILKDAGIDFRYTIVAQGKVPDSIVFQMDQLGLTNHVTIINGMPHQLVVKQIADSDVLLLPSVEEGIANVALEAMAVGTPVISTDCGGMNEVIINKVSGLIVKNRDVDAMAAAMVSFDTYSADERFSLAKAAKERIREEHNKGLFVKKYAEFYGR